MQVACAMRLGELRFTLVRVVMEITVRSLRLTGDM